MKNQETDEGRKREEAFEEWVRLNPPPTFEEILKRRAAKKAILAEVGPRMRQAVEANPAELRLIAKDAHGNTVIERPYRAPEKAKKAPEEEEAMVAPTKRTEQAMSVDTRGGSAVGAMKWGGNPMPGHGSV